MGQKWSPDQNSQPLRGRRNSKPSAALLGFTTFSYRFYPPYGFSHTPPPLPHATHKPQTHTMARLATLVLAALMLASTASAFRVINLDNGGVSGSEVRPSHRLLAPLSSLHLLQWALSLTQRGGRVNVKLWPCPLDNSPPKRRTFHFQTASCFSSFALTVLLAHSLLFPPPFSAVLPPSVCTAMLTC